MQVISQTVIKKRPAEIWELLLNSNVDRAVYCPIFCLGAPRPVRCEHNVKDILGEKKRRCVSNRGSIEQQIDVFEPPHHLAFHLIETDLSIKACLTSMNDDFKLESSDDGTKVIRTTDIGVTGSFQWLKLFFIWCGIKSVHRYVFKAWAA